MDRYEILCNNEYRLSVQKSDKILEMDTGNGDPTL